MPGVQARGGAGIIAAVEGDELIMNDHITRAPMEIDAITAIAEAGQDLLAMMLNLNRYTAAAEYPDGHEYQT